MQRSPNILVFDSGLGGLTVHDEIVKLRPFARYLYAADDAAFPYGRLDEVTVVARVMGVMQRLTGAFQPDIAVIACNTASTLVLPHLRKQWPQLPFVGTVPAIKPAAERTQSRMISVLATPATVARDYTQALIREHAAHCHVTLVGSNRLASLAEAHMHGEPIEDADIMREIAPCFVECEGRRTDQIVLACTHYPLLLPHFIRLAGAPIGWPVEFIDPAAAIARQTDRLLSQAGFVHAQLQHERSGETFATSGRAPDAALVAVFARYGLSAHRPDAIAFDF